MLKLIGYTLAYAIRSAFKPKGYDIKSTALEILDEAIYRSRKAVALIQLGMCSVLFICGGVFLALIDAVRQYDRTGHIYATATLWSGIIVAALFAGGYVWVFTYAWPGAKKHLNQKSAEASSHSPHVKESSSKTSDLEQAISLLVMDLVASRKEHREVKQHERDRKEARYDAKHPGRKAPPPPPPQQQASEIH